MGHSTVEEMAEYYIGEIKSIQPKGPYLVGGSSFGGLAAFEIAQQLRRNGEEVALLALIDTGTPDYPRRLPGTGRLRAAAYDAVRRFQHHQETLALIGRGKRLDYIRERWGKVMLKYKRLPRRTYKATVRSIYSNVGRTDSIPKKYLQLEDQIWQAGQAYEPKTYSGKLTLFVAEAQPLGVVPDKTLGWDHYIDGSIEIIDVPGHHGSIVLEPYVRVLAEKLRQCIDDTIVPISTEISGPETTLRQRRIYDVAHA